MNFINNINLQHSNGNNISYNHFNVIDELFIYVYKIGNIVSRHSVLVGGVMPTYRTMLDGEIVDDEDDNKIYNHLVKLYNKIGKG